MFYKMVPSHKLYRDPGRHTLGGVCTGLAYYFDLDPVLMKVIFIVAFLPAYLVSGLYYSLDCYS